MPIQTYLPEDFNLITKPYLSLAILVIIVLLILLLPKKKKQKPEEFKKI
ncbi:MAG: hypothetical protein KQA41_03825 [Candidatus Aenigmarchaeota archaeon]|nr:hypothetical protein [Candidatus Aenigmarchaeota archaeon]